MVGLQLFVVHQIIKNKLFGNAVVIAEIPSKFKVATFGPEKSLVVVVIKEKIAKEKQPYTVNGEQNYITFGLLCDNAVIIRTAKIIPIGEAGEFEFAPNGIRLKPLNDGRFHMAIGKDLPLNG